MAILALLLAAGSACQRRESAAPVRVDLVDAFPYTSRGQEAARIDVGTPGAAAYVLSGWSALEVLATGESVLRGIQRQSALQFAVQQPAQRRMTVRCRLVGSHAGRPQKVMVRLNHRWISPFFPQSEFKEYDIVLPASAQRVGRNVLEFSHRALPRRPPHDPSSVDTVAYEWIAFHRLDGAPDGMIVARDDPATAGVIMPVPASLEYFLRVPHDAQLSFGVAADKQASATLTVSLQRDGEDARTVWSHTGATSARINLAAFGGDIARLSLNAAGQGTLRLINPEVVGSEPAPKPVAPVTRAEHRPNVLLYIVDTLRADHLSGYGYPQPTSPSIDAFAHDAIQFTQAVAQASWTRPATASILTGVYPYAHGAITMWDALRPDIASLPEVLHAHGYGTTAFVTNVNVSSPFGFQRGFDHYTYFPEDEARPSMHVLSDAVNTAVFSWLDGQPRQPFFLYVHATDPHAPYTPPPELAARFRDAGLRSPLIGMPQPLRRLVEDPTLVTDDNVRYLISLYDGEIAFVDQSFGQLIAELKRRGLYDNTLIVFTADHGEEFQEHGGFEHARTLYQDQLWVPLLIRLPIAGADGKRVSRRVRQVDILPTVLDALHIPIPAGVQGRSLLGVAEEAATDETLAETNLEGQTDTTALFTGPWKVIQKNNGQATRTQVFNIHEDREEHRDIASAMPVLVGYAQQSIIHAVGEARLRRQAASPDVHSVDPATAERLRMLGYTN